MCPRDKLSRYYEIITHYDKKQVFDKFPKLLTEIGRANNNIRK